MNTRKTTCNRRKFLQNAGVGLAAITSVIPQVAGARDAGTNLAKPLPRQLDWQDCELGLVYHYDLDVFMPGGHHHERSRKEILDPNLYTPSKLDTDQWLEAAKQMGAGYAVLTATHHQGFLQWQSDLYPFGVKQAPWRDGKGDLVRDFVESCRRYGVKPGIYIGIRFNAYWQVYQYEVNSGKGGNDEKRREYMRVCERLVEELCSRYGDWIEIWFDGGVITPQQGGPDVLPIVDRYQPNAVFYHSLQRAEHRWAGSETGTTGYPCWATIPTVESQTRGHSGGVERTRLLKHGIPGGDVWCPAMSDAPIREHDWLWIPNSEHKLQPLEKLVTMYYQSVGRNSNLILGAVPNRDGLIPKPDFERYAELGKEIRRRFSKPLGETTGEGNTIEITLPETNLVNHIVVMEDIARGERIRSYKVECLMGADEWKTVCKGESVGHKRIQHFEPVRTRHIRLRVTESAAKPLIRKIAVYFVES